MSETEDFFENNPAFAGMDPQKLAFIRSFAAMQKPRNMNQAMPLLLAQMNLAKKNHIDFSRPEVSLIVELLSKDLSPEEKAKVDQMIKMMKF